MYIFNIWFVKNKNHFTLSPIVALNRTCDILKRVMEKNLRKHYINHDQQELLNKPLKYRPGRFWQNALLDISKEYAISGVDNFRRKKKI